MTGKLTNKKKVSEFFSKLSTTDSFPTLYPVIYVQDAPMLLFKNWRTDSALTWLIVFSRKVQ